MLAASVQVGYVRWNDLQANDEAMDRPSHHSFSWTDRLVISVKKNKCLLATSKTRIITRAKQTLIMLAGLPTLSDPALHARTGVSLHNLVLPPYRI
jgi:hypothetical protein